MQTLTPSLAETLRQRRRRLAERVPFPVMLWSGGEKPRNFPANVYPYRASSHFLYFAGLPLANAAIRLEAGRLTLFMDDATETEALWHGPTQTRQQVAEQIGADAAYPLAAQAAGLEGAAVLWAQMGAFQQMVALLRAQEVDLAQALAGKVADNLALAQAIVQLRMIQDEGAIAQLRQAAKVSIEAHQAGMAVTAQAQTEAQVRAAMEAVITANNMACAYGSIVTVHGEVLHNHHYHNPLQPGDLLLADVGAETETGWAADITRTWPVSGQFSSSQRDLYEIVLAAHDACIDQVKPGVEYRSLHLLACRTIAEGLVDLGILKGQPDSLVEQDAHALFFPHGVGHLLGLDVHDMEDLGDLAGYAAGRERSDRFGLSFLRLDRPLEAGMVVTIEPGFYQVPALLNQPERRRQYEDIVNWERLAQFADVRGIRIEDDVRVTAAGAEVLTAALPTAATAIEAQVHR